METIAVYDEQPIRTYGLKAQEGLCWLEAGLDLAAGPKAAEQARQALALAPRPLFSSAQEMDGRLSLRLCLPLADCPALTQALAAASLELAAPPTPASLIHLQGPHFGDRYGIAAAALEALAQAGISPLGCAGVVHSLFLVVEPGQAQAALKALAAYFSAPS